jgi:hypothetical protein
MRMAATIVGVHMQPERASIFIITIEALCAAEAPSPRACAQQAASLLVTRSLRSIPCNERSYRMLSEGYSQVRSGFGRLAVRARRQLALCLDSRRGRVSRPPDAVAIALLGDGAAAVCFAGLSGVTVSHRHSATLYDDPYDCWPADHVVGDYVGVACESIIFRASSSTFFTPNIRGLV